MKHSWQTVTFALGDAKHEQQTKENSPRESGIDTSPYINTFFYQNSQRETSVTKFTSLAAVSK